MASQAVSGQDPRFLDLLRGNLHLVSALVAELANLKVQWSATHLGIAESNAPQQDTSLAEQIAAVQPEHLVTWLRVNREGVERMCRELAEVAVKLSTAILHSRTDGKVGRGSDEEHFEVYYTATEPAAARDMAMWWEIGT